MEEAEIETKWRFRVSGKGEKGRSGETKRLRDMNFKCPIEFRENLG
jgi:hypothetical protein